MVTSVISKYFSKKISQFQGNMKNQTLSRQQSIQAPFKVYANLENNMQKYFSTSPWKDEGVIFQHATLVPMAFAEWPCFRQV